MDTSLTDKSLHDFAEVLAAKESVPGGGGAAAYVGALGIALASMVANFTVGKKRYAAYEEDLQRLLDAAEALRERLIALVNEDAQAFYPLSQAYAMPKDDPQRVPTIEQATLKAAEAPLAIMQACAEAVDLLEETYEKGSRMLLSDVGCGAFLCAAALRSAALNVLVNTRSVPAAPRAQEIEALCDDLLNTWAPRADALAECVDLEIRGTE